MVYKGGVLGDGIENKGNDSRRISSTTIARSFGPTWSSSKSADIVEERLTYRGISFGLVTDSETSSPSVAKSKSKEVSDITIYDHAIYENDGGAKPGLNEILDLGGMRVSETMSNMIKRCEVIVSSIVALLVKSISYVCFLNDFP